MPGSSYSPSDLLMAYLYGQFEASDEIMEKRKKIFDTYTEFFCNKNYSMLEGFSRCRPESTHNAHLFYLLFERASEGKAFKEYMASQGIPVATHFVPLHESIMGRQFVRPNNNFPVEEGIATRLVRLPIHTELTREEQQEVLKAVEGFLE
jgi:dTDP-4-amino-4,6-dideoxygalactose transaminase